MLLKGRGVRLLRRLSVGNDDVLLLGVQLLLLRVAIREVLMMLEAGAKGAGAAKRRSAANIRPHLLLLLEVVVVEL